MNTPWVESPFFEELLAERALPVDMVHKARQFHEQGYLVLADVVAPELSQRIIHEAAALYRPAVVEGERSHYRAQDGWRESPAIRELATHPRILSLLETLYGRRAIPFQTLNFCRGTQQAGHTDQIHFSSLPARFMCGVWVALEDVDADNGPLFYYPGSHRFPEYDLNDLGYTASQPEYGAYVSFLAKLLDKRGMRKEELHAPRGNALVWSSNIVHGGSPILDARRTRHSQVTHYYFADCIYYTPVFSNPKLGQFLWRDFTVDIRSGEKVKQSYNGIPFVPVAGVGGRKFLCLEKTPGPAPLRGAALGWLDRGRDVAAKLADRVGRTVTRSRSGQ
jgi:ectoine hydroxylase-related dioxygenase (phytanoyl-CoA dioxygenase family)